MANRIAGSENFYDLMFTAARKNEMDAAVARLDDPNVISNVQAGIGAITGPMIPEADIHKDTLVQKSGATTQVTHGAITGFVEDFLLPYPTGQVAGFRHQLSIQGVGQPYFSKQGDSGALVVSESQPISPIAMVFAGADNGPSFATPLERILNEFKATLL